jgi:hypothetical protein
MAVDYASFQDNDLTLPRANGDIDEDISFSTPNADTNKNGVLSLEVNPTSGSPTLELSINGTSVYTQTFGNNVQRVVQENFAQSVLQANNILTMTVTGNGSVSASDFHVLYKTL